MLEQDRSNMAHQNKLFSLMLNVLDGVDHSDIFAHLKSSFSEMELKVSKTMLAETFKELKLKLFARSGYIDTILIFVQGQTLQEVSEMSLISFICSPPRFDGRV